MASHNNSASASASWSWATFEIGGASEFGAPEEDEDGQDLEAELGYSSKACTILLIDGSRAMFEVTDDGEIPFKMSLEVAKTFMTNTIVTSENDIIAVCLYGTEKKLNTNEFDGVYILFDLDVPSAERIKTLNSYIDEIDGTRSSPFGYHNGEAPFGAALWTCSTMFAGGEVPKSASKRVMICTNNDNPNASNTSERARALTRAKDLADVGTDIDMFAFRPRGRNFDVKTFFSHILTYNEEDDADPLGSFSAQTKLADMQTDLLRKEFKKRAYMHIPLQIKDIEIGVKAYHLVMPAKVPSPIWLDAVSNKPLKSVTQQMCAETGQALQPHQMSKYYEYGGERVFFTDEEVTKMKNLGFSPGLVLMGFKPRAEVHDEYNIKHSLFLHPDDSIVKGSVVAFVALLNSMLAQDKVAIARFVPRKNAQARFVALLPQAESRGPSGSIEKPAGFHVIYLPYADDIRQLATQPTTKAGPALVAMGKEIIANFTMDYEVGDFANPTLQNHFASVAALALDDDAVKTVKDSTEPDYDGMDKRRDVVLKFKDAVFVDGATPFAKKSDVKAATSTSSRKRKVEEDDDDDDDGGEGPSTKKAKVAQAPADVDWAELLEKGKLNTQTVPALKDFLKSLGVKVPTTAKKQDLVDMVTKLLGGV